MRLWRLCRRKYARTAFDGEGARAYEGRWHERGTRVVYSSSSLSLALLEMLVHFDHEDAPADYVSITLEVPDDVGVEVVERGRLPPGWRSFPALESLRRIGTGWISRGTSAILRVPSAIVASEANYLVNPAHGDFRPCVVGPVEPFVFDPRLRR
jgi:RES domain-containing protein